MQSSQPSSSTQYPPPVLQKGCFQPSNALPVGTDSHTWAAQQDTLCDNPELLCPFHAYCICHSQFSPQVTNPWQQLALKTLEAAYLDFPNKNDKVTDQRHLQAKEDESAPKCTWRDLLLWLANSKSSHLSHSGCWEGREKHKAGAGRTSPATRAGRDELPNPAPSCS